MSANGDRAVLVDRAAEGVAQPRPQPLGAVGGVVVEAGAGGPARAARARSTIASTTAIPGCSTWVRPSASAALRASASMCRGKVSVSSSSIASGGAGKPACVAARSIDTGLKPSPSSAAPSSTSVPKTREVKKPRVSLTTIGVLPIASTKSYALASAASDVCSPTMISTSGILSTGEKKCSPMKSSRRCTPSARPVIGSVDVFEHSSASPARRCLGLAEHPVLELLALENRLDHEVAPSEVVELVGRRGSGRASRRAVASASGPCRSPCRAGLRVGLAPLGGLDAGVLEHHVDARLARRVRDAGTHHPGAEDRDPRRPLRSRRRRAVTRRR